MLYISLRPWLGFPGVPPYIDSTLTERIDVKDPYNKPVRSNKWYNYTIYRNNPVPPTGEFTLPEHLYCICSSIKKFESDFYYSGYFYRFIVSEDFLNFIRENILLEGEYDYCPVTMLSKKLEPIASKNYYLIRVFRFKKELIDFDKSPKVKKKGSVSEELYYPDLLWKNPIDEIPNMFFVDNSGFKDCFLCNEETKQKIDAKKFKGFALLSLSDFVKEHQFRDDYPMPDKNLAQQRDKIWF